VTRSPPWLTVTGGSARYDELIAKQVAAVEMGEHVGAGQYPAFGAFIEAYITPDMHMRPVGETIGLLENGQPGTARHRGDEGALHADRSGPGWSGWSGTGPP